MNTTRKTSRTIKVILISLGSIFGVFILLTIVLLIKGPADPVILTQDQIRANYKQDSTKLSTLKLTEFKTRTLQGEIVEDNIFSKYKVTMITIWGTFCSPCIAEMPELQKLSRSLPKDLNMLSICSDVDGEKLRMKALRQLAEKGATFKTLEADSIINSRLLSRVSTYPTTIFLDSHGVIIGGPYQGARTAEAYRAAIDKRVEFLKGKN